MKRFFSRVFLLIGVLGFLSVTILDSCQSNCQRKSGKFVKKLNRL